MNGLARLVGAMMFLVLLASPQAAYACPSWQEAVAAPSSSEAPASSDPFLEARAYNNAIYLMVGMPYLLLGTVGFLIYRAFRQKQAADLAAEVQKPCPSLSHGDHS